MKSLIVTAGIILASFVIDFAMASRTLPVYGKLDSFLFTDQDHTLYSSADLKGHVTIANFVFTACKGPCPLMSQQMAAIQKKIDNSNIKLISVSVDPTRDTPEKLKTYGQQFGADFSRWTFLTGPIEQIEKQVSESYVKSLPYKERSLREDLLPDIMEITHGENFAVIDRDGIIRAFHHAGSEKEITELLLSVSKLLN